MDVFGREEGRWGLGRGAPAQGVTWTWCLVMAAGR